MIDPSGTQGGTVQYLAGYDGGVGFSHLAFLLLKLVVALYLLASALAGFDAKKLSKGEIALRLVLAGLLISRVDWHSITALVIAAGLIILGYMSKPNQSTTDPRSAM